ncbi:MAG: dockerin, partial [Candidatus Dormibacteraeota bacterium]|nr:dockerin [Candidatus Dormibacteraeota bacterium]
AYNWGTAQGKRWWSVEQTFGGSLASLRQLGKPVMVAETACAELGGDKASWIEDLFGTVTGAYRDLVAAVVWFNKAFGAFDWRTDSSPAAQAAFKAGVASPGMLAAGQVVVSTPNR